MTYVADPEFSDYLRNIVGAIDAVHLASAKAAAQRAVDWYTCRNFDVAGSATSRTYAGNCARVLRIDDCTSITSITVAGTALVAADWQAEPVGARDATGRVTVYTSVRRLGAHWYESSDGADIVVLAAWGWPVTPFEVVEATKMLGKGIVELRNARGGVVSEDQFGPVRVPRTIATQAMALLDPLRGVGAFGIG